GPFAGKWVGDRGGKRSAGIRWNAPGPHLTRAWPLAAHVRHLSAGILGDSEGTRFSEPRARRLLLRMCARQVLTVVTSRGVESREVKPLTWLALVGAGGYKTVKPAVIHKLEQGEEPWMVEREISSWRYPEKVWQVDDHMERHQENQGTLFRHVAFIDQKTVTEE
ncbi:hypothetical protein E2I00_016025, partial [Balaenoptera physalus]